MVYPSVNTFEFKGVIDWRRQRPPDWAFGSVPITAQYDRFTLADVAAGEVERWFATLDPKLPVGIRIQTCVPVAAGKTPVKALPDNHGVPGAFSTKLNAFVPDYNSGTLYHLVRSAIDRIKTASRARNLIVSRWDIGWGSWDEGHTWGLETTLEYLKPTAASLKVLTQTYAALIPLDYLYLPIGGDLPFIGFDMGTRRIFCDGVMLRNAQGQHHAQNYWNDPKRAAMLDQCWIVGEPGSSDPSKLNFDWLVPFFAAHPNFIGFADGNLGKLSGLTADQKSKAVAGLTLIADRAANLSPSSVPTPPPADDRATLLAQVEVLRQQLRETIDRADAAANERDALRADLTTLTSEYNAARYRAESAEAQLAHVKNLFAAIVKELAP